MLITIMMKRQFTGLRLSNTGNEGTCRLHNEVARNCIDDYKQRREFLSVWQQFWATEKNKVCLYMRVDTGVGRHDPSGTGNCGVKGGEVSYTLLW